MLAPKTVRRGADFTVSVSILQASRDVRVRAELMNTNNATLVSNSTTVASGERRTFLQLHVLVQFVYSYFCCFDVTS